MIELHTLTGAHQDGQTVTVASGRRIGILDPHSVVHLHEIGPQHTVVHFSNGNVVAVVETYEEVEDAIRAAKGLPPKER